MYIVAEISIILVSQCVLAKASSRSVTNGFTVSKNFPSRLYLPTIPSQNPEAKNRVRTSDIEAVLENDLQVIPLAVDHDQRNGFQYQPIISRQYSRGFTESPRYLQSAVPNLPQIGNTRRLESPITNANEVKPITKSQLSREAVACSSRPKENNENHEIPSVGVSFWCLGRRFQFDKTSGTVETSGNLPKRKILTVNDQENNTHQERLRLQLTPPRDGISRISRHQIDEVLVPDSSTKSVPASGPWSKKTILIGQPSSHNDRHDVKPVFENNDYGGNFDNYNIDAAGYNEGNYQSGNHALTSGSSTCGDVLLKQFLLQNYEGLNYGYNTRQHLPTNPILALLLSHYGKYISGPRVYSYMAVNNIHNNKPFGSYKLARDEDEGFIH